MNNYFYFPKALVFNATTDIKKDTFSLKKSCVVEALLHSFFLVACFKAWYLDTQYRSVTLVHDKLVLHGGG